MQSNPIVPTVTQTPAARERWEAAWSLVYAAALTAWQVAHMLPLLEALRFILAGAELRSAQDHLEQVMDRLPAPCGPDDQAPDGDSTLQDSCTRLQGLIEAALGAASELTEAPATAPEVSAARDAKTALCRAVDAIAG